jgi:hypothetical protein
VLSALLGCSALAVRRAPQAAFRAPAEAEPAVDA